MSQNKTIVRETRFGSTRTVTPYKRHNRPVLDVEYEELPLVGEDFVVSNWRELLAEANADRPNLPDSEKSRAERYVRQQLAYHALVDVNTLSQHQLAWTIVAEEQAAEYAAEQRDRRYLMLLPF